MPHILHSTSSQNGYSMYFFVSTQVEHTQILFGTWLSSALHVIHFSDLQKFFTKEQKEPAGFIPASSGKGVEAKEEISSSVLFENIRTFLFIFFFIFAPVFKHIGKSITRRLYYVQYYNHIQTYFQVYACVFLSLFESSVPQEDQSHPIDPDTSLEKVVVLSSAADPVFFGWSAVFDFVLLCFDIVILRQIIDNPLLSHYTYDII